MMSGYDKNKIFEILNNAGIMPEFLASLNINQAKEYIKRQLRTLTAIFHPDTGNALMKADDKENSERFIEASSLKEVIESISPEKIYWMIKNNHPPKNMSSKKGNKAGSNTDTAYNKAPKTAIKSETEEYSLLNNKISFQDYERFVLGGYTDVLLGMKDTYIAIFNPHPLYSNSLSIDREYIIKNHWDSISDMLSKNNAQFENQLNKRRNKTLAKRENAADALKNFQSNEMKINEIFNAMESADNFPQVMMQKFKECQIMIKQKHADLGEMIDEILSIDMILEKPVDTEEEEFRLKKRRSFLDQELMQKIPNDMKMYHNYKMLGSAANQRKFDEIDNISKVEMIRHIRHMLSHGYEEKEFITSLIGKDALNDIYSNSKNIKSKWVYLGDYSKIINDDAMNAIKKHMKMQLIEKFTASVVNSNTKKINNANKKLRLHNRSISVIDKNLEKLLRPESESVGNIDLFAYFRKTLPNGLASMVRHMSGRASSYAPLTILYINNDLSLSYWNFDPSGKPVFKHTGRSFKLLLRKDAFLESYSRKTIANNMLLPSASSNSDPKMTANDLYNVMSYNKIVTSIAYSTIILSSENTAKGLVYRIEGIAHSAPVKTLQ